MALRFKSLLGLVGLAGFVAPLVQSPLPASCQNAIAGSPPLEQISGFVIREIDDSATGDRWLLVRDAMNPGGPGRMMWIGNGKPDLAGRWEADPARKAVHPSAAVPPPPVIHAGDSLIVEEHTSVVEARLEAVALTPAAVGAELKARLKIGGKVVRAVARAAGKAEMLPESEAER